MNIATKQVDYLDPAEAEDLLSLLAEYATLEGGEIPNLTGLPNMLADFPTAFSVMAYADSRPQAIGLINCFLGFSTFHLKPLVNVHDVIVTKEFRGMGVSGLMLKAVEQIAEERGCCRLTLEVHANNTSAVHAYQKFGFTGDPSVPNTDTLFLRKSLT